MHQSQCAWTQNLAFPTVLFHMTWQVSLLLSSAQFNSVQSLSPVYSLQPNGLQHARPPCPSPTPSLLKLMSIESVMPSNHLILSVPFSSCLQSFPASGSFHQCTSLISIQIQNLGITLDLLPLPSSSSSPFLYQVISWGLYVSVSILLLAPSFLCNCSLCCSAASLQSPRSLELGLIHAFPGHSVSSPHLVHITLPFNPFRRQDQAL